MFIGTKNKTAVVFFCFLFAALSVCHARESNDLTASAASPYPVYDSGVWADWQPFASQINWIDDHRIIFKTVEGNDKQKIGSGPFNLSVWEIGKDVKAHTPYVSGVHVCVRDGMVRYTLIDEKGVYHPFYGKFGKEKAIPLIKRTYSDELNCPIKSDPEIAAKLAQGRNIYPLLDRHGYLDRGPVREKPGIKEPAIFYRTGHSKGIELPILGRNASIIRYYPFKGAYLIHGLNTGGIPNKKKQFWWLYPDGKVEEGLFHFETNLYPTRKGIVTVWGGTRSAKDPGTVGLYLWNQQEPIKLIAGYAEGITVSPDGGKLAFASFLYSDATNIKDPARITLKAINVCTEEKTHGQ